MTKVTLFERVGGFSAVRKVVTEFYDRVLESKTVGHHFENINVSRLIDHQTKFIATLMGGPAHYSDEMLHRAHMHLSISRSEFFEIVELLEETLEDAGFKASDITDVRQVFLSKENLIVTQNKTDHKEETHVLRA